MTRSVPIRDLVQHIIGGGWGSEVATETESAQVAIIRGADFPDVQSGNGGSLPVRFESPRRLIPRRLEEGDIVLEISGGTNERPTGRSVFVSGDLLRNISIPVIPASFCRLLRPRADLVEPKFLYYWLQDMYQQGRTWAYQVRSTGIANFQTEFFLDQEVVRLPFVGEQRRIAGVLGALDDLIELNQGLIADLIAMADAIASTYVGRGEESTFGEVCEIFGGGTPSTKHQSFWNGAIRWATPSDITAMPSPYMFDTVRHITQAGLDACSSKLMPVGSILMTSRATIGAFAVAQVPTAINQGFIAVQPRVEADRWFIFHEMRRRVPEFIQRANGSTFLELSRGVFKGLSVCWPSAAGREELHRKVAPLHVSAAALQSEIAELSNTRDELLPLLMSGRVRVGDVAA
jgi:type I restriction enzyme S subunit